MICEISFKGERVNLKNEILPRYNFNKANWPLFKIILFNKANLKSYVDLENCNVNDLNELVCKDILEAADTSIPKQSNNSNKTFPKSILDLIDQRRIARKKFKKNKSSIKYKSETFTEKKWDLFLGKLGPYPVSFRAFLQIINKLRSKKSSGVIPSLEYNNLFSEKLNEFSNILENTFRDSYDSRFEDKHCQFVKTQVSKINWDLSDDNYFSVGDIYGVINRLKVGKSPGDDGIHN